MRVRYLYGAMVGITMPLDILAAITESVVVSGLALFLDYGADGWKLVGIERTQTSDVYTFMREMC